MKKLISFILVAVIFLAACGGSSDGPVTVTTGANETVFDEFINKYIEENPDANISWEPITGDYQATLSTRIAGGSDMCVMAVDYTLLPKLVDEGKIIPLDEYLNDEIANTFVSSVYDSFKVDGKQYGLPLDYNTLGVFYNKEMFDKAGVEYPTSEWTFADYKDAMEKIKPTLDEGQVPFSAGNEYHRFRELVLAAGSDFVNEDKEFTFATEENIETYDAWFDLYKNGLYQVPAELGVDWGGQAFFDEKAAITIEGSWAISAIEGGNPDLQYGTSNIPLSEEGAEPATMIYSNALTVSSDCTNKDLAFDFINWYTSPEISVERNAYQKEQGTASGGIPTNAELMETFISEYPEYQIFAEGGEYGTSSGMNTVYDQIIINNINSVMEESIYDTTLTGKEQLEKAEEKAKSEAGI